MIQKKKQKNDLNRIMKKKKSKMKIQTKKKQMKNGTIILIKKKKVYFSFILISDYYNQDFQKLKMKKL